MPDALVLGAGISGLAAGRALRREGADVVVLEAAEVPGGTFRTAAAEGFAAELGPTTVQESAELRALAEDAGCADRLVAAAPAARRRYVVHRGRLVPLPGSPPGLLRTPLLSWRAKARLAGEPWRRAGGGGEESVAAFFRRRLGPEPVELLVDAMVLGIYAGDPEELTMAGAFPRLAVLEREHGSLFKGLRKGGGPGPRRLVGAVGGWQAFAAALAGGIQVEKECRVEGVTRRGAVFQVRARQAGARGDFEAPRLVAALPAPAAARALAGLAPQGAAGALDAQPHAPVAVVVLGWERAAVAHPLDGFGFLAPHREGRRLLGAIFTSTLFPAAAPAGRVLVTAMAGGRRRPELADLPEPRLLALAREELADLLGAQGAPVFARVARWRPGIPQPTAALAGVRAAAASLERANPGLTLLGNWLHGVGVPDCVRAGWGVDSPREPQ